MILLTKISPRKWLLLAVALLIACALLFMVSSLSRRSSSALGIAPDLLAVHKDMTQDGLSGFLPGNHSRLPERIRAKRFKFVTVMPIMVQAGRAQFC